METQVRSKQVAGVILIILLLLSGCGPSAEEVTAFETKVAADIFSTQTAVVPTVTNTVLPTATNTPKPTMNRTATAAFQSTQEAQPMADLVQQLYDDGYLQSFRGEYFQLDDFEKSFAMMDWVDYYPTGINLDNFVLHSDIAWQTAKRGTNIYYSGCGFWFGIDRGVENFHEILITLDGNVTFSRCLNDCLYMEDIKRSYFGKVDYMQGEAELVIVVEDDTIQAFVNGRQILIKRGQKNLKGDLAYAICSGTNAGFGTRCTFSNTQVWSLEP